MAWQQLRLTTRYPDFAEEILEAQGAVSVSVLPAEGEADILEPAPGETPLWPRSEVAALFGEEQSLSTVLAALHELLPDAARMQPAEETVADSDWVRACLDEMQAMRFGRRLWICPHHRQVADADAVVVRLDPGLAFGTGTHPTTALCLQWLDEAAGSSGLDGLRVLDYGCGSGILAVAAARLGAAAVTAVDIDPQALRASAGNAADNGVGDRLTVLSPEAFAALPSAARSDFDIVVANILAEPLVQLAPTLSAATAGDGALVLAGLLDRQAERVAAAYPDFQLHRQRREGWTRLAGRRAAPPPSYKVQQNAQPGSGPP